MNDQLLVHIVFSVVFHHGLGLVNFALHKSAVQSTTYNGTYLWSADKAVDGNRDGSNPENIRTCSATYPKYPANHTWEVDIGLQIIVKNIMVYGRSDIESNQLYGVKLYLGNTSEPWIHNQEIPSNSSNNTLYVFKPNDVIARVISLMRTGTLLTICEVTVEGVCGKGTYGYNCNETCGNCLYGNNSCSTSDGNCSNGCKPGWQGYDCKRGCERGNYGYNCNETCGNCLYGDNSCSTSDGNCLNGCKPGWQGYDCKRGCERGNYGYNCNETCGNCLYGDNSCSTSDGNCLNGCKPGWQGYDCKRGCERGNYGYNCNETCGNCLYGDNSCSTSDGNCLNGCKPGWQGYDCKRGCERGNYGYNCNETCGNCLYGDNSCSTSDGNCLNGCKPGWQGYDCKRGCERGNYGYNCNETCGNCLYGDNSCSTSDGNCLNGCKPGWQGYDCKRGCERGNYGYNCNETCGNCLYGNNSCSTSDGNCSNGCKPGWQGYDCKRGCERGNYGYNCNETCGNCLYGDNSCSKSDGNCSNGCKPGWQGYDCKRGCERGNYGYNCNETCGNCLNGNNSCSTSDGNCSNGCKPAWQGYDCKRDTLGSVTPVDIGPNAGVIVGSVLAAVGVSIFAIIIIIVIVKKRKRNYNKPSKEIVTTTTHYANLVVSKPDAACKKTVCSRAEKTTTFSDIEERNLQRGKPNVTTDSHSGIQELDVPVQNDYEKLRDVTGSTESAYSTIDHSLTNDQRKEFMKNCSNYVETLQSLESALKSVEEEISILLDRKEKLLCKELERAKANKLRDKRKKKDCTQSDPDNDYTYVNDQRIGDLEHCGNYVQMLQSVEGELRLLEEKRQCFLERKENLLRQELAKTTEKEK